MQTLFQTQDVISKPQNPEAVSAKDELGQLRLSLSQYARERGEMERVFTECNDHVRDLDRQLEDALLRCAESKQPLYAARLASLRQQADDSKIRLSKLAGEFLRARRNHEETLERIADIERQGDEKQRLIVRRQLAELAAPAIDAAIVAFTGLLNLNQAAALQVIYTWSMSVQNGWPETWSLYVQAASFLRSAIGGNPHFLVRVIKDLEEAAPDLVTDGMRQFLRNARR